jgi:hypothetical protein
MLKGKTVKQAEPLVLVGKQGGITVIPSPTPLTRLHYFDGKFLRARDLELEQSYLRQLVALSNQAGGSGVVHGFDCDLEGNSLSLGPGLAIDGKGRVLLLPESRDFDLAALIEASRQRYAETLPKPLPFPGGFCPCGDVTADEGDNLGAGASFYLISICHAEALCGEEDVFGKLCAAACQATTERPYTLEGVVLRALPLELRSLLPTSTASPVPITGKHLRSRLAAAYFEDERKKVATLIAAGGLESPIWCHGAAAPGGDCVPLALVARAGSQTLFLDGWTARRERIETPPRRFWSAILAMRPWDVYLAQVLQFQCQLAHCIARQVPEDPDDPCREAQLLLRQTAEQLAVLIRAVDSGQPAAGGKRLDYQQLETIRGRLADAAVTAAAPPKANRLLHCGIVELPSAGYLPVDPGAQQTVNEQVRAILGDSLDLRFCVVRPDFVPHAFEEAQHMERISLLHGFDHPADKPKVDILVPDGQIEERTGKPPGTGYVQELKLDGEFFQEIRKLAGQLIDPNAADIETFGSARGEIAGAGTLKFYYAGRTPLATAVGQVGQVVGQVSTEKAVGNPPQGQAGVAGGAALWLEFELRRDPFELEINDSTPLLAEIVEADYFTGVITLKFFGELTVTGRTDGTGGVVRLGARLTGSLSVNRKLPGNTTASAVFELNQKMSLHRKAGESFGPANAVTMLRPMLGQLIYEKLEAGRLWAAAGEAELKSEATPVTGGDEIEPFGGKQKVDAAALLPGHPAHAASLAGLGLIGYRLGDPSFADVRSRRLFPPVKPGSQDLVVRARLPWVLFHRRRDKTCATIGAEPQVQARRFRLYHIELQKRSDAEPLLERIGKGLGLDNYNPQFVATVEFAAGLAAVQNAFEPLQDSWDAATEDGAEMVFGVLAGQGQVANDGETLAEERLKSLAQVLDPITPSGTAEFDLLDAIHPDLPANGLDGSIVYATVKAAEPAIVCQTVYLVSSAIPRTHLDSLLKTVESTGFAAANFPNLNGFPVTTVLFKEGTSEAVAGSLDAAKTLVQSKLTPSIPTSAVLVVPIVAKTVPVGERAIHTARSAAVRSALGSIEALDPLVVDGGTVALPEGCSSLSLLVLISPFKP